MTQTFDPAGRMAEFLVRHGSEREALLPLLHDLQAEQGLIDEDSMRALAHALNLSRAEVYGVVSFYHDFRTAPETRPVIKLCRAEACQARGVEALVAALPADFSERFALETVYCLGLCSVGPNALVGGQLHARLDAATLAAAAEAGQLGAGQSGAGQ